MPPKGSTINFIRMGEYRVCKNHPYTEHGIEINVNLYNKKILLTSQSSADIARLTQSDPNFT